MLSQAIQQVLFTRPLEKEVPDIVKKYGGSLYIPSPANCFQDSAGTTPCTVDSVVGLMLDTANPVLNRNLFKNTGFLGGVAGSPGTVPTSVSISGAPAGMTRTLAYGITADGRPYVDVAYSGTNTSGSTQYPGINSTPNTTPATSGQKYTISAELALISGSWPTGAAIQALEFNSSSGYLTGSSTSIKTTVTTSTLTKVSLTRTLNNASTAYVSAYPVTFTVNNNEAVNFTVRIANPQLELGSTATNFVPNTYMGYSVNQIQGNHATQGTAGYKPILRGKVKNWAKYSNDVTNSAWTNYWAGPNSRTANTTDVADIYGTYTANKLVFPSYTGTQYPGIAQDIATPANVPYVIQMWAKGSAGGERIFFRGSDSGTLNFITLTTTWTKYTLTRIDTAVGKLEIGSANYNNSCTIYVMEIMYETGDNISTYIPTTSAAASSSYGPYWLDFDGTDDRLQLGSVPFQLQDDPFAVVGAFIRYSTTVNGRIIDTGSTSARIQILSNNTTGYLGVGFTDDTTASQFLTEAVNSTNTYNVHTLYKLKDVKLNRRNSQQKAINTTALSVSTCTASYIGCAYSPAAFTGMQLYSIALGKGAPLTDISKIEKYAAKLSGAQL